MTATQRRHPERDPHLADGGAHPHAARSDRPRPRRHRARRLAARLPSPAVRRRAGRRDLHPGRHQPLQRLLRRPPRRRRRGPPRPGPRHRRRTRAATTGADRHLRVVRRGGARRRLPGRRRRLAAAARRRRLDPRRRPVHRRPQALRLRGPRRAVRVPVLRDRRRRRLVLRAGQAPGLGGVRAGRAGRPAGLGDPRGQQLPRHRLRPPRRQTHARGPPGPRQDARRCSR